MSVQLSASSPWPGPVRAATGVLGAAGGLVMVGAWIAANDEDLGAQIAMAVVAAGGCAVVALAVVLWVLSGRRGVEARLAARFPTSTPAPRLAVAAAVPAEDGLLPVASVAMGHFHRPTCLMTRDKPVRPAPVTAHRQAGRRPCEVCRPDA